MDKHPDRSLRILFVACVAGIALSLVFAIWRIQIAQTQVAEMRAYAVDRDRDLWPIVHEIRDGVKHLREHMDRQESEIARLNGKVK